MLLLVVGESEAIVNALEQLLENLEQTESEEQIQSVAQAELQQLSTELNRSLEESLANLENSWNPAGAAAGEIANRDGPRQTAPGNAPAEAIAPGASEVPSRSRGFMAWLPAGTPPKGAVPPSVESTGGPAPATAPVPRQVRTFEAKRAPELAQQPGRGVVSGRAGPLAKTQLGDPSPSKAAAISANPEVSDHEEGRRPRRVLIQIICEPAA
jgi:hypothetical protein